MKISVNWIQDFVKLSPPLEDVAERLTMAGLEVKKIEALPHKKDIVWDVEITSNRPDWLSHRGVAREISAVENLSLHLPETDTTQKRPMPAGWKINIKDAEGCPYYSGILIEGLTLQPTPDFIRDRLEACGLRSIHLIVDITNYVLLETGQPLHAFDADLLSGKAIQIRRPKEGEKLVAIDGRELSLQSDDLVIADDQCAVALAGVMGGKATEVNQQTRNIFLESAFFHPRWIRQTSRRHAISSESSYRFERRVDPEGVDFGRDRALWLIQKYAKPRFISAVIKAGQKPVLAKSTLHLSETAIEKVLGTSVKPSQVALILGRLGLNVSKESEKSWNVRIPSFRSDLSRSVDLIEEVARIYGYDWIPETLPERAPLFKPPSPLAKFESGLRQYLAAAGLYETVTFSLISEKELSVENELRQAVSIINPQNKELCWMRPVLLPSLLDVIRHNQNAGNPHVFIFEIANAYSQPMKGKPPVEEKVLSIALFGNWKEKTWLDPERKATFYDLKGIIEGLLKQFGIGQYQFLSKPNSYFEETASEALKIGSTDAGFLGEVHSRFIQAWGLDTSVFFAQISLEKAVSFIRLVPFFSELPRYPSVERDIAVVVPEEVKTGDIQTEIVKLGGELIHDVRLFDLFRGGRVPKGYKNLGIRVTYLSRNRTLVSEEIQKLHTEIAGTIARKFEATFQ
ncbi:MAG TPA: phenylalanine--tRNA ligase subunit beta [bacterium]|nr:phenylalanine--tRNA ligase subunit beta [bacterium]